MNALHCLSVNLYNKPLNVFVIALLDTNASCLINLLCCSIHIFSKLGLTISNICGLRLKLSNKCISCKFIDSCKLLFKVFSHCRKALFRRQVVVGSLLFGLIKPCSDKPYVCNLCFNSLYLHLILLLYLFWLVIVVANL